MTLQIGLVLFILVVSLVLFVSEKIRMDLIALMVLGTLVLTGLVTPPEAVAGFSNAAVIAVWAMFILSDGLTRTGIANVIGHTVLRLAGRQETRMIVVIMLTAGILSAFMNNIGVAALMLPVVIDVARRTRIPASRLLMPLAYGSLLGGLTTMIGTPPNLLISGSLEAAGYSPFGLFDFTPIGGAILVAGTLFVALVGKHMLPRKKPEKEIERRSQRNLRTQYGLQSRAFEMRVPSDSILVGKTLGQSRIGVATGLIVLALERDGKTELMPSRQTVLQGNDNLLIQGRLDRFHEFQRWSELVIEREAPVLQGLMAGQIKLIEVTVADSSPLVSELLHHSEFRKHYGANVLAIRRDKLVRRVNLANVPLRGGDVLLLQASTETVEEIERSPEFADCREVEEQELSDAYRLQERIFVVRVPRESPLAGDTLMRNRLGDAFDFRLLALFREGELKFMPEPDQSLKGGDLLLIQGREEDLDVLRGLQELEVQRGAHPNLSALDSDRLTLLEATLNPRSTLPGQPLSDFNFREKFGLELVAVWRNGEAIRTNLDQLQLQLGDALLLLGPRQKLAVLERDPEFIVLTPVTQRSIDTAKAPLAGGIMLAVVCIGSDRLAAHLHRRSHRRDAHDSDQLPDDGRSLPSDRVARDLSDRRDAATRYGDGADRCGGVVSQSNHERPRATRALVGYRWALFDYGRRHDDHPDGRSRRTDVTDRALGQRRPRRRATDRDDGRCHGRFCEFHEPNISSGKHSRHGPGRLSLRRLFETRVAVDSRRVSSP